MFTTGSKLYFGLAGLVLVALLIYSGTTNGEAVGTMVLIFVLLALTFVGSVVIFFRDAEPGATAVGSTSAADAEGDGGRGALVSPSVWPLVGGFSAAIAAVGLVVDSRVFIVGLVGVGITVFEWMVQSWADRASSDPAYNAGLRGRMLHPIEFPVAGALTVGAIIFAFSRVMLALPETGAIIVFASLGALVLAVAVFLSVRPRINRNLLAGVGLVAAAVVLGGAIAGVANGEHRGGEEADAKAKAVADKANTLATIVRTATGFSSSEILVPRSLSANLMFRNKSGATQKLIVHSKELVTKADGSTSEQPVDFTSPEVGDGKAQVLTVRFTRPGTFQYTTADGGATGTIVVP